MAAYSLYMANKYDDAVNDLERFIAVHPGNRDIAYAYYLKALAFYERSNLFNDQEKAVIHFADQVTRAATTVRDSELAAMRKYFSEEQIVELVSTIAVANFTNRVNDALLALPDLG